MKQLPKTLESKVKIRFPDCDPFNHLNNSKYIDYFINTREDQLLEHYDFDIYKMARQQGVSWVVAQNQVAYLAPAMLMETVVIQTQLIDFSEKNLTLEAIMWNEDKTVLKALLWSKLAHFDLRTQKSRPHDQELSDFFSMIVNPLVAPVAFEERIRQVKNMKLF